MSKSVESVAAVHPFAPIFNADSKVLILGSFPSVSSREQSFYYGHPSNRFWKVLSAIFNHPTPKSIEDKKQMLFDNRIALWDVVAKCEITGSSDSSIRNVVPNDLSVILNSSNITKIVLNGKTSERYYNKFIKDGVSVDALCMPSTSPANAAWTLEKLIDVWYAIAK